MNTISLTSVDGLAPRDALAIIHRLTRDGSEFQAEVASMLEGVSSSSTPLAIWELDGACIGWAASHIWRDMQTLELFVDPRHRGHGRGSILAGVLVSAGRIDKDRMLAVFSSSTASIAARLGCRVIVEHTQKGNDWLPFDVHGRGPTGSSVGGVVSHA
jgi:GNAT superfamily N-acetyltransferase